MDNLAIYGFSGNKEKELHNLLHEISEIIPDLNKATDNVDHFMMLVTELQDRVIRVNSIAAATQMHTNEARLRGHF